MTDIAEYFEAVKSRYGLSSDYALAKKLGIAQPEANLMRRAQDPKAGSLHQDCQITRQESSGLLLVAQKDKAPRQAKEYWTLA